MHHINLLHIVSGEIYNFLKLPERIEFPAGFQWCDEDMWEKLQSAPAGGLTEHYQRQIFVVDRIPLT